MRHCQPISQRVSCGASGSNNPKFFSNNRQGPPLLMQEQKAFAQLDPLLHPFVQAASESAAQDELEALLALVAPLTQRITARGRSPEDDCQESLRQTLVALRQCRQAPQQYAIGDLQRYASVVASHVTRRSWRNERPVYQQLKESLRHTLRNEAQFALWQTGNGAWLCGLQTQRASTNGWVSSARLTALRAEPLACDEAILPGRDATRVAQAELLAALFGWLGHALRFEQLTPVIFALRRLSEATAVSNDDNDGDARQWSEQWIDEDPLPEQKAEWSAFLVRLWREIEQLPPLQRIAYLLNFTAGEGALDIFWLNGVASIRRIGAALQLTEVHFARAWDDAALAAKLSPLLRESRNYDEKFAFLWQHLPLNDQTIARMLDTERQKVINLRKAAGDRLARRLAAFRPAKE
ncbi:MAG: hypothetical protein HOP19_13355 [Acidobacteria bacterium]|nr:hypothetical protein [Acidobacteriota bacterium]